MSAMIPMAVYGLEVPAADIPISARPDIPAAFRITMAAIDPTAEVEGEEGAPQRATLKIIRQPLDAEDYDSEEDSDDEDGDDFDADEMERILAEEEDDDDDEDEEMVNGGPSDPTKSKKARKAAAEEQIKKLLAGQDGMDVEDSDSDDVPNGVNGVNGVSKSKKAKGKMPASDEDEDDDEDEDEDEMEMEEFVICTLDPTKNYNQPLDITVGEDERVWFKVTGTHSIFLTGNYVEPANDPSRMYDPEDDEGDEYDMEPSDSELEEDELDDMADPRITEIDEVDEAPKLVEAAASKKKTKPAVEEKKAGNKRPADDDEPQTLDDLITSQGEPKLSKKQLKKMKKNDGTAAAVEKAEEKADAPSSAKSDKKVSFAKNLEQGPTPTTTPAKDGAADKEKPKATTGIKVVQGVTIDEKKVGTGPAAKNGDRVGMRYIGKLQKDNKVFDSNKKGKPFTFKLGAGNVIKGWEVGVAGMSVGGERRLTIPASLGYGSKGAPPDIPANATLIFDIKCLEVSKGGK